MLLTIFALLIGLAIGRARGGHFRSLGELRLNQAGLLAIGITAALVQAVIGPSLPVLWMLVAYGALILFGIRNLQLTGIIVAMIGIVMNLVTVIANGSVPVSERALRSVGEIDGAGQPIIEGIRESTETATSFDLFADIVPVPIFGVVVSLGDLIILVALADITMHVMLRYREREPDPAGFSYSESQKVAETTTNETASAITADTGQDVAGREDAPISILSPTSAAFKNRPAHALHRRPRLTPLASLHIPAHAKPKGETNPPPPSKDQVPLGAQRDAVPVVDLPETVIIKPEAASEAPKNYEPAHAADAELGANAQTAPSVLDEDAIIVLNNPDVEHGYIETASKDPEPPAVVAPSAPAPAPPKVTQPEPQFIDGVDPRPIIDLTNSPTDEQLFEFLRRRNKADQELAEEKATAAQLTARHRLTRPRRRGRNPAIDLSESETRV